MYLGGNQKLLEFINYEYPQLHKFKINILYQTKAMQYYRNNLNYLVNGGPKPVKPNEKINAYELVDINDYLVKNEKINMKYNNKTNKISTNNNNTKEKKRNKSVGRIKLSERNTDKREKNKTYKIKRDKRSNSLSHTDNDDNLKRHKSFYKEMNKLFGENCDMENPNIENNLDNNNDNNSVYSKKKIKKENKRRKSDSESNSQNNKFIPNTNYSNKTNFKEYPIGHIYNNNYFTLSATKNIFMFNPNKDSIIYKHRKINTIGNPDNNPALKAVKEIYYKPKIPYLINTNKKKINNENLYFSLKEHYINDLKYDIDNENNNDLNQINNNLKSLNTFCTYPKKNRKNNNENGLLEKEQYIKDDNDIVYNGGVNLKKDNNNNENINNETFNNTLPYKKKENLLNGDEDNININNYNEKKGNNIIYRNYKKNSDNNFNYNYNYDRNKTELKNIKIDKIIKTISNNIHNEIDTNLEDVKNKTFLNKKDYKRKIFNKANNKDKDKDKNIDNITINKTENGQKDPIRIEEGDEEIVGNTPNKENINIKEEKNDNNKLFIDKRKTINIPLYGTNTNENETYNIIKNINKENDEKKYEKEKNKDQVILREKKNKENIESNEENESYFNKEKNKRAKAILSTGRYDLKRGYKKMTLDNSKDNKKKDFQNFNTFSVIEKNIDLSKTQKENISNIEPKKLSIRNKYKMKKMNEMV